MFSTEFQSSADLVFTSLTVTAVLMSAGVVAAFHRSVIRVIKLPVFVGRDWLILGIYIGFVGGTVDSLYWLVAWTLVYLDAEIGPVLMRSGSLPNIFSRNLCDIASCYCHLLGISSHLNTDYSVRKLLFACLISGFMFAYWVWTVKTF